LQSSICKVSYIHISTLEAVVQRDVLACSEEMETVERLRETKRKGGEER